jgi:hypothetical protein
MAYTCFVGSESLLWRYKEEKKDTSFVIPLIYADPEGKKMSIEGDLFKLQISLLMNFNGIVGL